MAFYLRNLNGGSHGSFAILEYQGQSNSNSECVPLGGKIFKYINDLTTLVTFNLLMIGRSSYNVGTNQLFHPGGKLHKVT